MFPNILNIPVTGAIITIILNIPLENTSSMLDLQPIGTISDNTIPTSRRKRRRQVQSARSRLRDEVRGIRNTGTGSMANIQRWATIASGWRVLDLPWEVLGTILLFAQDRDSMDNFIEMRSTCRLFRYLMLRPKLIVRPYDERQWISLPIPETLVVNIMDAIDVKLPSADTLILFLDTSREYYDPSSDEEYIDDPLEDTRYGRYNTIIVEAGVQWISRIYRYICGMHNHCNRILVRTGTLYYSIPDEDSHYITIMGPRRIHLYESTYYLPECYEITVPRELTGRDPSYRPSKFLRRELWM